ncbi:hypothetical protein ACFQWB_05210 [Paenibacillus thermoaerophilus]|uniref:Uncharacterized protein n=1 Tax=Paenibacillus thermoaerophilus TaxID=1215385 RepID=A0ABW2V428_9BACL|nr:hypothetical protein [Paenibacillus thermoaerophilus]TMV14334.1 hypothetical protein FE781_10440 [Paenibacillus thermoaerophilus]
MERIVLLVVAFVMGYVFIVMPMPVILVHHQIASLPRDILSLAGLAMMIYSAAEIVMSLIHIRRGGNGKK